MTLKTKINVNGQGLYNEIGVGKMLAIVPISDGSLDYSGVYTKEDGTIVKTIESKYTSEQVETLYQAIKDELTPDLNGVFSVWEQVYLAFRIEMAQTFEINVNQIEICE